MLFSFEQDSQSTYLFGKRFKNRLFVGGLPVDVSQYSAFFNGRFYILTPKKVDLACLRCESLEDARVVAT